jgi:hypothetical protein
MRLPVCLVLLAMVVTITGCGRGETDQQLLKRLVPNASATKPVTGIVTVDGVPVKDLWVTLHPTDPEQKLRPRAQTDPQGRFQITTYVGGDGAPSGDYTITIEWLRFSRLGGAGWVGPDKLDNQYSDPKTTSLKVTVKDAPVELPAFQLTTKGGKPEKAGKASESVPVNNKR